MVRNDSSAGSKRREPSVSFVLSTRPREGGSNRNSPSLLSEDIDQSLVKSIGELGVLVVQRSIGSDRASLGKERNEKEEGEGQLERRVG